MIVMSTELINDPLLQFRVSSNHLGDVYEIPNKIGLNLDLDLIMSVYIHCEIKYKDNFMQIIVIHNGAINKSIAL